MEKLAIIGTGITGMGCAYFLNKHFDITVFEQNKYAGGHTNTVYVNEDDKQIPVDTGFIVCNKVNYPLLMKLFDKLQVPLKNTSMSFAAQHIPDGIEYSGSSINLLFAHRKNIINPRFIKFLVSVNRFNKNCVEILENKNLQQLSIGEYAQLKNYGMDFLNWYILPMSSALWSTPPHTTNKFPALTLVQFFKNHGLLGLNSQFNWLTVNGGSEEYKKLLTASFKDKILLDAKVVSIKRQENSICLKLQNGTEYFFDKVIIASHADQALEMLNDANSKEKEILSAFTYQKNRAVLHTDDCVMPQLKKVWSSWNYRIEKKNTGLVSSCTYWMNSLQQVSKNKNYFITINDPGNIDKKNIIREFEYEHPVFTLEAMHAQQKLDELNANDRVYFCGSYARYGFHEDALRSAVQVCEKILKKDIWN